MATRLLSSSDYTSNSAFFECGCCCEEFQFENMVQCSNGHPFCFRCLRRRIEEIIYGGLRAHASLSCMSTDYCMVSIPISEIRRALQNDVIERYEYRQAQESIVEAKLDGLVYCPFCNIPYIVDVKCVEILDCPNPKCLKASCIKCKKLSHVPLQCEEVEEMSDTHLRRKIEERMSKAVIRECNICHTELIKLYGCNMVTCRCGNQMCYICRQTMSYNTSRDHFCSCMLDVVGKSSCKICNKCSLFDSEEEEDEALAAKEEALKELVDKEPKLLDLEIGPPLKTLRQRPPGEEQGHDMQRPPQHFAVQRFPPYWIVRPPEPEQLGHHIQRPPPHLSVQRFPPYWFAPPPEPEQQGHHMQRPQHLRVQRFPPSRIVPPPEPEQQRHHMQRPQHFLVQRFLPVQESEEQGYHMQRPPQHLPVQRFPPNRIVPPPQPEQQRHHMQRPQHLHVQGFSPSRILPPPEPEQQRHHMQRPPQHFPVQRFPPSCTVPPPESQEQGHHMQRPPQHLPVQRFPPSWIVPPQESEQRQHHMQRPQNLPVQRFPPSWTVHPPHFFRFGDGDRLGNMVVPPQQFFGHDDQLASMQLTSSRNY